MELLERYLQAVRRHLPWMRQDDIIAELRANLEAQLEDKEAELGRKLTGAEVETWLKQMGAPIQVAARYQPQRSLIGPGLFPIYWFVLKLALGWCAVIYTIANVVEIVMSNSGAGALLRVALNLPGVLFINAAVVTLIFAAIELAGARIPGKVEKLTGMTPPWSPDILPPFAADADKGKRKRTYAHAVAEVIFGWIFLAWLLLVPHHPFLLWGPGVYWLDALPYQLAPVWWTFYWWIVALNVIELAWHMADLLRGTWQGPRLALHFVKSVVGLAAIGLLLAAPGHALFLMKSSAVNAGDSNTLAQANLWTYRSFQIVAVITVLRLVWEVGRMSVEAYRRRLTAAR